MKDAYTRRRTKARVEKSARLRKLDIITLEFAKTVIEEETGTPLDLTKGAGALAAAIAAGSPEATGAGHGAGVPADGTASAAAAGAAPAAPAAERRLIARDANKNPLLSPYAWTEEAVARVFRVPAGFMRNQTQERIEALAAERGVTNLDLALVEEGIEFGKQMMAAMIEGYKRPNAAAPAAGISAPAGAPNPAAAPVASPAASASPAPRSSGLNEVGRMSIMAARREE